MHLTESRSFIRQCNTPEQSCFPETCRSCLSFVRDKHGVNAFVLEMRCSADHQVWDTQAGCKVGAVVAGMILDKRSLRDLSKSRQHLEQMLMTC